MNRVELLFGAGAAGPVLALSEPISFWGGVDPVSGTITQPRHAGYRQCLAGTVLVMPGTIGSSSGSAILLELIRIGRSPVAIVLQQPDAILTLGAIVAEEMGYGTITMGRGPMNHFPTTGRVRIDADGSVTTEA